MRLLLVLTFCLNYFLNSCAVSKCYEYSNIDLYLSNLTIRECDKYYSDFCAISKVKNGVVPKYNCGDDEFCTSKGCYGSTYCTKPGTFEHNYPGLSNVKFTITCCDTDLCNVESSATALYKCSSSCLFYMSVYIFA